MSFSVQWELIASQRVEYISGALWENERQWNVWNMQSVVLNMQKENPDVMLITCLFSSFTAERCIMQSDKCYYALCCNSHLQFYIYLHTHTHTERGSCFIESVVYWVSSKPVWLYLISGNKLFFVPMALTCLTYSHNVCLTFMFATGESVFTWTSCPARLNVTGLHVILFHNS